MNKKPIYIKKENCDFERLFETLELETGVTSIARRRPTDMHLGGAEILGCDVGGWNGLCWCEHEGRTEIYCEADFVAEVKRRYPKKEETYCVNVEYLDWSKFAARIEEVSYVKWNNGESLTRYNAEVKYVCMELNKGLTHSSKIYRYTELVVEEFIKKCAELCPKKSIYDELEPGDLCFVRDRGMKKYLVREYAGNGEFYYIDTVSKKCWGQATPLGKNVRDYPELEASDEI